MQGLQQLCVHYGRVFSFWTVAGKYKLCLVAICVRIHNRKSMQGTAESRVYIYIYSCPEDEIKAKATAKRERQQEERQKWVRENMRVYIGQNISYGNSRPLRKPHGPVPVPILQT